MFLRTGGDTLITNGSYYEPLVIAITIVFIDTDGDRCVGDWPICSSDVPQQMVQVLGNSTITFLISHVLCT